MLPRQMFDDQVEAFQRLLVQKQLQQCTSEQQEMFYKTYPKGVNGLKGDKIKEAYLLCTRTITKNKKMEFNVCETCGAKDGRAGTLIKTSDGSSECFNCRTTRKTGNVSIDASLSRNTEEIERTIAILKPKNKDLNMPEGLSNDGEAAYRIIMSFLEAKQMTYTGGCKAFYSPMEWKTRGEQYGLKSVLIVTHDGGDLAPVFNLAYERGALHDELNKKLEESGLWCESCTSWYTAIYNQ